MLKLGLKILNVLYVFVAVVFSIFLFLNSKIVPKGFASFFLPALLPAPFVISVYN